MPKLSQLPSGTPASGSQMYAVVGGVARRVDALDVGSLGGGGGGGTAGGYNYVAPESEPPDGVEGETWFAPDTGNTYLRYDDGTTVVWLQSGAVGSIGGSGGGGGVELTGDQTIAGIKEFTASPLVPGPTTEHQAASKGYVDETALLDSEVDADVKTLSLPANTTISAFAATFLDAADAATVRTTIGVPAATTVAPSIVLTQAEYNALTPTSGTVYFVVG